MAKHIADTVPLFPEAVFMKRSMIVVAMAVLGLTAVPSQAVHFYRGPGGGCAPRTGNLGSTATPAATVMMLHNTFNDLSTGTPVTRIKAGQTVRWSWNSAHCHSVGQATEPFASGFYYPTTAPNSPVLLPGFFDYPIPETNATLSFTRTFPTAGTFRYSCIHHAVIGMTGVVIVE